MRKSITTAIFSFFIGGSMCLISCNSNDDILEELDDVQTENTQWVEPFHTIGSSAEQVKTFMANSMKAYSLQNEITSLCFQLSYSNGKGQEGVLYSFWLHNGQLYSVIDTESMDKKESIIAYLRQHYNFVGESDGQLMFTNKDKTIVICADNIF